MSLVHQDTEDDALTTAVCTMALEIVTVLFNYDVCLNPALPVSQRMIDDTPIMQEVHLFCLNVALGRTCLSPLACISADFGSRRYSVSICILVHKYRHKASRPQFNFFFGTVPKLTLGDVK